MYYVCELTCDCVVILQWTVVTDDLEELLKTAANQVTDSLVTEVNSKMTSADSTAQKVEDNATEMNTLLSQVCLLNWWWKVRDYNSDEIFFISLLLCGLNRRTHTYGCTSQVVSTSNPLYSLYENMMQSFMK